MVIKQTSNETIPHMLNEEELSESEKKLLDTFCTLQSAASTGPQMEGVSRKDALTVIRNPKTIWAEIRGLSVPAAYPLECDSLANDDFYERRGGMNGVFMLSSTIELLHDQQLIELTRDLKRSDDIKSLIVLEAVLPSGDVKTAANNSARLTEALIIEMPEQPMIDSTSNSIAEVIHFTGLPEIKVPLKWSGASLKEAFGIMVVEKSAEVLPETGTSVLRPEDLSEELIEKIWTMYDKQLDILIEDHPAYQRLDRELVVQMLNSQTSFNIAHFVDGEPVCLFIGVADLKTCDWLNAPVINGRYPNEDVLYCPALVTDFEKQGHGYASNIFKLLSEIVIKRGKNVRPYFECTDISANYVPKILEDAINSTGLATVDVVPLERYRYRRFDRL